MFQKTGNKNTLLFILIGVSPSFIFSMKRRADEAPLEPDAKKARIGVTFASPWLTSSYSSLFPSTSSDLLLKDALEKNTSESAQTYLAAPRNPDRDKNALVATDQSGYRGAPLHHAIKRQAWHLVRGLLGAGASKSVQDNMQRLPLHWAARSGQVQLVKLLACADTADRPDGNGQTPAMLACIAGQLETIQFLHEVYKVGLGQVHPTQAEVLAQDDWDPDQEDDASDYKPTSLMEAACRYGHLPIVIYLHERLGVPLDQMNPQELTKIQYFTDFRHCLSLMDWAAFSGNLQLVHYLVAKNIPIHHALYYAAFKGHSKVIQYLIDVLKVPIDDPEIIDGAVLRVVVQNGPQDRVEKRALIAYLLDKGASPFTIVHPEDDGFDPVTDAYNALEAAAIAGDLAFFILLAERFNPDQFTPRLESLAYAILAGQNVDILAYAIEAKRLRFGKYISVKLIEHKTIENKLPLLRYLFRHLDVNLSGLLHCAVAQDDTALVSYLQHKGADVNEVTDCWQPESEPQATPLFVAKSSKMIDFLIEGGANIQKKSNDDWDVLYGNYTFQSHFKEPDGSCLRCLLDNGAELAPIRRSHLAEFQRNLLGTYSFLLGSSGSRKWLIRGEAREILYAAGLRDSDPENLEKFCAFFPEFSARRERAIESYNRCLAALKTGDIKPLEEHHLRGYPLNIFDAKGNGALHIVLDLSNMEISPANRLRVFDYLLHKIPQTALALSNIGKTVLEGTLQFGGEENPHPLLAGLLKFAYTREIKRIKDFIAQKDRNEDVQLSLADVANAHRYLVKLGAA